MKNNHNKTKRRWLVPLLLLACFFSASSPVWAATREFNNCPESNIIAHNPTLAQPYLAFHVMYYDDTKGNNGFFLHKSPNGVPSGETAGPALFVNDQYICTPDYELAWPGGSDSGNSDGATKACSNDSWWGNTYTRNVDGVNYTVKFYNPYNEGDGSKRKVVYCLVFMDKIQLGKSYSVTISGYWKINNKHDGQLQSNTWTFNAGSMGLNSPTAEMTEYGKMKINGNLNASYGPTTVGSYSGATTSGLKWTDNLTSKASYAQGNSSFSNQEVDFSERANYYNESSKYIEYIIPINNFTPSGYKDLSPKLNIKVYQWYVTKVPGYIRPKGFSITSTNLWTKEVKFSWSYEGNNKGGTWSIFRYPTASGTKAREVVASNLSYSTSSYTATVPGYDTNYTYELSFIPTAGEQRTELTASVNLTLARNWNFSNFTATTDEDKINLSWHHTAIGDASGSKSYSLEVQRSENGTSFTTIKTIPITSTNTNEGTHSDNSGLVANRTYYYRLKINVLDTDIYSSVISTKLGGSKILDFTASRGSYSGMVKLQWTVKQVGSNVTNFIIQRRPLNSVDERAWTDIHTTSGTASGYSYDDVEAKPGSFYEYKVIIWSQDGNTRSIDDTRTIDGFSIATGVVSGRVTFGTGAAVEGVKVTLKQQTNDGTIASGMHSVKLSGYGAGMRYATDNEELKSLLSGNFSIQMYMNPNSEVMSTDGSEYRLFDVEWAITLSAKYEKANDRYKLCGYFGGSGFNSNNLYIPAGQWSNLTVVNDSTAKTLTIYVIDNNGEMHSEVVTSGRSMDWSKSGNADCMAIGNVGKFTSNTWFEGYLDEFRYFTKALTETEILRNYNHPLAGNETGLAIYYPFDEGLTTQNLAYDFSKSGDVSNGRHAVTKVPAASDTHIPSEEQLSLMAYTDTIGNYVVRGIPFSGEGTNYSVIPTKDIHEFSPSSQSRFISQSSLIHSGVDFEDISSFPVSGTVYYEDTDYPVEGVSFYVDGVKCSKEGQVITTDKDGKYEISVPIGSHYIQLEKNGHVFANNGRYPADPDGLGLKQPFKAAVTGLDFSDATLVNFTGRVVGGSIEGEKAVGFGLSKNNLGQTEIVLMPQADYRLNVKKEEGEATFSYENNKTNVAVASATEKIASTAYRKGGVTRSDCQKIVILTDPKTGEFSAMLPPLQYSISSMKVVKNSDINFGDLQLIDLTNPTYTWSDTLYNDARTDYELYEYNTCLRQTYHSTPTFNVTQDGREDGSFGISSYTFTDEVGKLTIDDIYTVADGKVTYNYGVEGHKSPIFVKEDTYIFKLRGFEHYVNADNGEIDDVPLAGNVVTINNALSADQAVYIEDGNDGGQDVVAGQVKDLQPNQLELDSLGYATYKWQAGMPNIAVPYTRTISMTYDIDGRTYQWEGSGLAGIILGDLPTGNNFVTAGPDKLLMILRDPPGTNSFAEWTSGSSTTTSKVRGNTFTENAGVKFEHKFGLHAETIIGTPATGQVIVAEAKDDLTLGAKMESSGEDSKTTTTTTTVTQAISTSAAPEYVGAQGDVFIGTSTNIVFGKARDLNFHRSADGVELGLLDIVSTGVKFNTMFSYTQNYIENVLFPNFELLRQSLLKTTDQGTIDSFKNTTDHVVYLTTLSPDDNDYGKTGTYKAIAPANPDPDKHYEDSVRWVTNQIKNWIGYLAQNDSAKVEAFNDRSKYLLDGNVSFDSGTTITSTTETENSTTNTWDWTVSAGLVVENSFGFELNGFGVDCTIEDETMGGRHEVDEEGKATTTSFSYTLAEDGDDDALSVDVLKFDAYGPIFHTRGGQTCCPYEGQTVTKYYKPGTTIMEATMQIEVPQIDVDVPTISDIPTGAAANYTLRLSNASEIDEDVYYRLLVADETNPDGAALSIDGKAITDSRVIKIPAGQTVTKALQLKQTNVGILDYENIAVVLASQCQYDPTSTWDVITDTVYISAHFVPSSSPVDLALSNTLMNTETGTDLGLTFSNFDRTYRGLKAFRLQYKKLGATDWTLFHEYVLDKSAVTTNNELLPASGGSVSYTLPMQDFTDGDYLFRVLSVSSYGTGETVYSSKEIAMVKDMQRPVPLGLPEPADGVLSPGDEISITFNEDIIKGALTKTANFKVTGVLNGAEIDHETALRASGGSQAAAQTEADISLAERDFSIDAWVKISGAGEIASHGNASSKMTIATDADSHLIVDIAGTTYTSTAVVPTNTWAFLSLSYQRTDAGGEISATVATADQTVNLFSGEPVVNYEGNGPIAVGRNLSGAMHELLLWEEAHDMTTALLNRYKSKSPATRNLIGYWKMNEGEGTLVTDYARNRHMTMPAETWYINNENKAVELSGDNFITTETSDLQIFNDDDYAIEFWMRGDAQTGEAQLLQMGEVALWTDTDGKLNLTTKGAYNEGEGTVLTTSSSNLLDNTWHHVALNMLRQGAAAVYVDGARVLSTNAANVGGIASDRLFMGARRTTFSVGTDYTYDRAFKGQIDELRIWGASMNADLLANQRKMRLTGKEDGLLLYFPFEKKKLDEYNQVVTEGSPTDLAGTGHEVQISTLNLQSSVFKFTDEAPALRTKPTETNVGFTFTASDTKIVLDIDEDASAIEGCTLTFTVRDVSDKNGNYSLPAVWSAYINRNELVWKESTLNIVQPANTATSFNVAIQNKGGQQQMWTITGMPAWLSVSAEQGNVAALSETNVNFTVDETAPIGKYEVTIYLEGNSGIETPLTLNINVEGEKPDWAVNGSDYESTMNVIAMLDFAGTPCDDADDMVAAFIGDECRGVGYAKYNSRYDSYFILLNISGNRADDGKPITLRAYDASTGIVYSFVESTPALTFSQNKVLGTYTEPVLISTSDLLEQNIALGKGWTWMSVQLTTDDMTVPTIFSSVALKTNIVKSKEAFMEQWDGQWYPANTLTLNNREMYMVQMTEPQTLSIAGHAVDLKQEKIEAAPGWNWIGYPGTKIISIGDAFAGMEPHDGDVVKSQSAFAMYDGYEWNGTLGALIPGEGYMLRNTGSEARTFTYPTATASAVRKAPMRRISTAFTPIDHHNYSGNMNIVGLVTIDDQPLANGEIAVYAGDECRTATLTDAEGYAYITVPGEDATELTFKTYCQGVLISSKVKSQYVNNDVVGSHRAPLAITFSENDATGIDMVGTDADSQWFDIAGRKLVSSESRTLRRGIYIRDGKKIAIK